MSTSSASVCKPCAKPSGISSATPLSPLSRSPCQLQEGRRAAAQVDGDVEHLAAQALDELLLGARRTLEVQAANAAALGRAGVVDLRDGRVPAGVAQLVGAEEPRQEAALIAEARASHALQAGERRVLDLEPIHAARLRSEVVDRDHGGSRRIHDRRCRPRTALAPTRRRRAAGTSAWFAAPLAAGPSAAPRRAPRAPARPRARAGRPRAAPCFVGLGTPLARAVGSARQGDDRRRPSPPRRCAGRSCRRRPGSARARAARRGAGSRRADRARAARGGSPAAGGSSAPIRSARRGRHRESAGPRSSRRRR